MSEKFLLKGDMSELNFGYNAKRWYIRTRVRLSGSYPKCRVSCNSGGIV